MNKKKVMAMVLATSTIVGVQLQKDETAYAEGNDSNNYSFENIKSATKGKVIGVQTKLRIRKGPSTTSNIVGHLSNGEEFQIIGQKGEWYEIKRGQDQGYISKDYVKIIKYENQSMKKGQVVGVTTSLRVREKASKDSRVIGYLNNSEKIDIASQVGEWYKIKKGNLTGYVHRDYVKIIGNINKPEPEKPEVEKPSGTYKKGKIVNVTTYVNVREKGITTAKVLGSLKNGESVDIVEKVKDWYKIKYRNGYGYIYGQYVKIDGNTVEENKPSGETAINSKGKVVNITSNLRVREKANTNSKTIGSLKNGQEVSVVSKSGGWYKIKFEKGYGYVHGDYIKLIKEPEKPINPPKPVEPGKPVNPPKPGVQEEKGRVKVGSQLRVREKPTIESKVVGQLNNGDIVLINGEESGFYKINYKGLVGYASKDYIEKITGDISDGGNTSEGEKPTDGQTIYTNYNVSLKEYIEIQQKRVPSYSEAYFEDYISPSKSTNKYQFLRIDKFRNIKSNELDKYLEKNDAGVLKGQSNGFVAAAKKYNLDPVYLVAQSIHETGYGKSTLAKGVEIKEIANLDKEIYNSKGQLIGYEMIKLNKPVKVYNLYGIGAYDNSSVFPNRALIAGTTYAYNKGWTSIGKAIEGAAEFVSKNYVHSSKYEQNTLYKMRYMPNLSYIWHQYATSPWYAKSIGEQMETMNHIYSDKSTFIYDMPRFKAKNTGVKIEIQNKKELSQDQIAHSIEKGNINET